MAAKCNNLTNINAARLNAGLTQKQLAQRSGVNYWAIVKYCQGVLDIDGASISTLAHLSHALNVPIYRLLNDQKLAAQVKEVTERDTTRLWTH